MRVSRSVVALACVGGALTLAVMALSASIPAPSFARSFLGTPDAVAVAIARSRIAAIALGPTLAARRFIIPL